MIETLRTYLALLLIVYGFNVCWKARAQTAIHLSMPKTNVKQPVNTNSVSFHPKKDAGNSNWVGRMGWIDPETVALRSYK